jgi:hypothetical protein
MRATRSPWFYTVTVIFVWVVGVTAIIAHASSRSTAYIAVPFVLLGLWRCIVWICAAKVGRTPKGMEMLVPLCLSKRSRPNPAFNSDARGRGSAPPSRAG